VATLATALEGEPRSAAIVASAQLASFALARLITPAGVPVLLAEILLAGTALALAPAPVSAFFAGIPLLSLWGLAQRARGAVLGIATLTFLLIMAGLTWAWWPRWSLLTLGALATGAGAIVLASLRADRIQLTSPHADAYELVSKVNALTSVDHDPITVAGELVDALAQMSGQRDMALESAEGRRLATTGNDDALAARMPLLLQEREIATLLSRTPIEIDERMQDLIDDRIVMLGIALAFEDIRSRASDAERSRLSREMHDGIAQEIASLGYVIDDLLIEADDDMRPRLRELRAHLTRVVADLRLSIFELRGRDPGTGLGVALSDLVERVRPTAPFAIHLRLDVSHARFPRGVEDEMLRIAQEALTNAKRHSGAENVWVSARLHPPVAELTVEDDGVGLTAGRSDSFGLEVMRERASAIGAALTVRDRRGGGTVVYLLLSPSAIPSSSASG
jgi:signal transduction histidine kinase